MISVTQHLPLDCEEFIYTVRRKVQFCIVKVFIALLLVLSTSAKTYAQVVFDFESLPTFTQVGESYSLYGAHFEGGNAYVMGGLSAGDPGNWDLEGSNGPQFLGFNTPDFLTVTFDKPITSFSMDVAKARGVPGTATMYFSLSGFRDGKEVYYYDTIPLRGVNEWSTFSVQNVLLDSVRWHSESLDTIAAYGVDNIRLTYVPEPRASLLLLLGVSMFWFFGSSSRRRLRS